MRRSALLAVAALAFSGAEAATISLDYQGSNTVTLLHPEDPLTGSGQLIATTRVFAGPFYEFDVSLEHEGSLSGAVLDFDRIENLRHWFYHIVFDENAEIVAWDVRYHGISVGLFQSFLSEPEPVRYTADQGSLPAVHYGESYSEPFSFSFDPEPGSWTCLQDGVPCAPMEAPIPASLALLLSGLGIMALFRSSYTRRT